MRGDAINRIMHPLTSLVAPNCRHVAARLFPASKCSATARKRPTVPSRPAHLHSLPPMGRCRFPMKRRGAPPPPSPPDLCLTAASRSPNRRWPTRCRRLRATACGMGWPAAPASDHPSHPRPVLKGKQQPHPTPEFPRRRFRRSTHWRLPPRLPPRRSVRCAEPRVWQLPLPGTLLGGCQQRCGGRCEVTGTEKPRTCHCYGIRSGRPCTQKHCTFVALVKPSVKWDLVRPTPHIWCFKRPSMTCPNRIASGRCVITSRSQRRRMLLPCFWCPYLLKHSRLPGQHPGHGSRRNRASTTPR